MIQNTTTGQRTHSTLFRALRLFAALMATGIATSLPAHAAILTVDKIEVTQAIQTLTNSVGLVARRSTAVRAYIKVTGSLTNVSNVSGRLHVFVGASEVTPLAGVAPINAPFTAKLSPVRANQNDTLNFELPAPTAITASSQVTFRVDLTHPTATTNSLTTPNLTFRNRRTPFIYYTRINYTPSGLGLPTQASIQAGRGDLFVRGIFPVNDADPNLYRQGLFPTLTYNEDSNGDGRLNALGTDGSHLLTILESCRQLIVNNGTAESDRVFLYAWINGNPIDGNGVATINGRVALGNTEESRFQRTFAHELTHNFGFNHNNLNIDEVGWDVGARLPGNPVGNNTTGRVKPTSLFDIMTAGLLTNQAWVHTQKYTDFYNHETLQPDFFFPFWKYLLVVRGILDPDPGPLRIREFLPVFRYPWKSQETFRTKEQPLLIARAITERGVVINVPFRPDMGEGPEEKGEAPGAFSVAIPTDEQVSEVSILSADGEKTLGRMKRTTLLPAVQSQFPERGQQLGTKTRVKFTAEDGDSAPTELMFQAAYSPDDGRSFVPINVDFTKTDFTFDSSAVPPSFKSGLIRIFASDGLNTSFTDIPGLTTPAWLGGTIRLEANQHPGDNEITFEFRPTDNAPKFTRSVVLNLDSTFTLTGLPLNKYIIAVKGKKWLQHNAIVDLTQGSELNFGIGLLTGDANGDNSVNFDDFQILADHYFTSVGDPLYDNSADFNDDGEVNFDDFQLLADNYFLDGDQ